MEEITSTAIIFGTVVPFIMQVAKKYVTLSNSQIRAIIAAGATIGTIASALIDSQWDWLFVLGNVTAVIVTAEASYQYLAKKILSK